MGYNSHEMHPSQGREGAVVQGQVVQQPCGLPSIITEAKMGFKRGSDPLFFPPIRQPYSQEIESQALEPPLQKRVDAHTKEHCNAKETQQVGAACERRHLNHGDPCLIHASVENEGSRTWHDTRVQITQIA